MPAFDPSTPDGVLQPSILRDAVQAVNPAAQPQLPPQVSQLILTIKPSILTAMLLRLLIWAFLIDIVLAGFMVAKRITGFDSMAYLLQAARDAVANLQQLPEFAALLNRALESLSTIAITIAILATAIVLLRTLPLVTKCWRLYEDRLEYSAAFRGDRMAPLAAIALVASKRCIRLFDFGSITVVLSGVNNRAVTIPMVIGADAKAERIRDIQRAAQAGWMRQSTAPQL